MILKGGYNFFCFFMAFRCLIKSFRLAHVLLCFSLLHSRLKDPETFMSTTAMLTNQILISFLTFSCSLQWRCFWNQYQSLRILAGQLFFVFILSIHGRYLYFVFTKKKKISKIFWSLLSLALHLCEIMSVPPTNLKFFYEK